MHSATPYFNIFFEFLYNLSFWPFYWLLKKFDHLYDTKIIIEIWVRVNNAADVKSDNPGDLFRNGSQQQLGKLNQFSLICN